MDKREFTHKAFDALARWGQFAERHWSPLEGDSTHGYFGTGYDAWGVQTVQKYVVAMAALATHEGSGAVDQGWALSRAIAALRFNLGSHKSGSSYCTDGSKWGHNWLSALGIERMMGGVTRLIPYLSEVDLEALRRMLISEARWAYYHHFRYSAHGIFGSLWSKEGKNAPESNIWTGALLWRVASMYPEHPEASAWKQRACVYFINGVSLPDDAFSEEIVDGLPVKERFHGPNFFPNFALDHHHYLNVGYMVICTSNAAMLHFDAKGSGWEVPASLHYNHERLWGVIRKMIFSDGRLARIGGDSRIRYSYCQDYLLPALFYAADHLRDGHAFELACKQLDLFGRESELNPDGSFYGKRLAHLASSSPYYYTRLESDRASVLAMAVNWIDLLTVPDAAEQNFDVNVCGNWAEPEHGAVLQRDSNRLASFAWRSYGLTQALCQPPNDGSLADWDLNLVGRIEFQGDVSIGGGMLSRRLLEYDIDSFEGGFVTAGIVIEGSELFISEGWRGKDSARNYIAVAALPDGQTMLGVQFCKGADRLLYVKEIKGIHLNVPNDLYNGFQRRLKTQNGIVELTAPAPAQQVIDLNSRWVNVDEKIGLISFRDDLRVSRSNAQRGGAIGSLYVDEICAPCLIGVRSMKPGSILLDSAWAALSGADSERTQQFSNESFNRAIGGAGQLFRGVLAVGADGKKYCFVTNCSEVKIEVSLRDFIDTAFSLRVIGGFKFSYTESELLQMEIGGAALLTIIE